VAALCDSAMGATVVTYAAGRPVRVANTDLHTSFLRPVEVGTVLRCEAIVVSGGRRVVFTEATVSGAERAGVSGAEAEVSGAERAEVSGAERAEVLARASATYLLLERR
jgi:acyl-coenzyme A thioesterase PaaI-like protein